MIALRLAVVLSVCALPAQAAEDAFSRALVAVEKVTGANARPGRDLGCFRPGVCEARLGLLSLRTVGNAAGATLTLTPTMLGGEAMLADACAGALAAVSDLDETAARHVVAASEAGVALVDGIAVSRSVTPIGPVCRLRLPASATAALEETR